MLSITLNLPDKLEQQLDKDLQHLEILTDESKEFHIQEAIVRYLEYADKLIKNHEKHGDYTIEQLLERLNLKKIDWEKKDV